MNDTVTAATDAKKALDLLHLKQQKLKEMLQVTQTTQLTDSTESINDYVAMIDQRESILNEVKHIEEILKSPDLAHVWQSKDVAFDVEADRLQQETRHIIEQIIQCDKKIDVLRQTMLDSTKKNLKRLNDQKNVNAFYQNDLALPDISTFDKQK